MRTLCVLAAALSLSVAWAEAPGPAVTQELHDRALAVLHEALDTSQEWAKVHAAESLVWTGHPEGVYETFLKEVDGALPPYRIGVARVLAQAAPTADERQRHQDRILDAFLDSSGPDRLHAVETLAKLGYAGRPDELVRVARDETGSFQAYARWALANSGAPEDEAAFVALLDAPDADVRGCVAYGLRFFKTLRPASFAKLTAVVGAALLDSKVRVDVHLLSAAYVHAPAEDRSKLRTFLEEYADNGTPGAKREVYAALGRVGDPADLPSLVHGLDDADLDARAGAAEAILRIEGR